MEKDVINKSHEAQNIKERVDKPESKYKTAMHQKP